MLTSRGSAISDPRPRVCRCCGPSSPGTRPIPFENVEVLLKRPIYVDLPSIRTKLVDLRRGGYCFEQNTLLMSVLHALGFDVSGLAARVIWGAPPGKTLPRTHMLLRVILSEGTYLADVGFGGLTPTAPLAFELGDEQPTPHEAYRLVATEDEFELQAQLGEAWRSLYRFSLQPQIAPDYEVANWFTSTHPGSLFRRHLLASRPAEGCRHSLFDNRLTIHHLNGVSERRVLTDARDLGEALSGVFGIALANPADLMAIASLMERNAAQGHANPFDNNG
jgi:N-hydroxyarylamine O-acetyltransferase